MELSKKNRNSGKSNVEGDFEVSILSSFFKLNRLKKILLYRVTVFQQVKIHMSHQIIMVVHSKQLKLDYLVQQIQKLFQIN